MMKKNTVFAAALLLASPLLAADVDITVETPSRVPRSIADVPGAVEVILPRQLQQVSGATLDQKLQALVPGLNTNRESIYSHGSNMSMRGVPGGETGQAMTLVMVDGVPLNNAATGGVQWNALNRLDIDHIEVFRGPGSSIYGSNALAGVVNIITKKAGQGYSLETSYGTYDTFTTAAKAGAATGRLAVQVNGGYQNSKGYYQTSETQRAPTDRKLAAENSSAGAKASYDLKELGGLTLDYDHYKGRNMEGQQLPGYPATSREKTEDRVQAGWKGQGGGWYWNGSGYYQRHDDDRTSIKSAKDTFAVITRKDTGGLAALSRALDNGVLATGGLDYRYGSVDGRDHLTGAAPYSYDQGKTYTLAPYLQLERKLLDDRLNLLAAMRYDNVSVYDGYTKNTQEGLDSELPAKYWDKFSPKVSAGWKYGDRLSQYVSYSKGFKAPTLESMVLSIKRSRIQMPNPGLKPESAGTIETGFRASPFEGLFVDPSLYLTRADDLIYFNYYTVGATNYQVYKNLAKADIYGVELPVKYMIGNFTLSASYAQSHSRVAEGCSGGLSIKDKQLTFSPRHIYSAGASYTRGSSTVDASWTHKSKQYVDEFNTSSIGGYSTAALTLTRRIGAALAASLACDNLFNERHMESDPKYNYLSPGRTITATLKLTF